MKKKKVLIISLCAAAVVILAVAITWIALDGIGGLPPELSREEAYNPKLDEFYAVIADPENADVLYDGLSAVRLAALEFGDEALDKLGYEFEDVNNDGKDELFIGCFGAEDTTSVNNEIYAAFSYDGQEVIPLFEKQKRNTYALTDSGTFYFYGSDGAKYFILAEYVLGETGEMICKDFYFTYPKNGDGDNFGYYHNTTGQWDPAVSEEIQMTAEELEALRQELAGRTVAIDATKFSEIGKQ